MTKLEDNFEMPIVSQLSFFKVFESLERTAMDKRHPSSSYAKNLLDEMEEFPLLREGFTDISLIKKYRSQIDRLSEVLFPEALLDNEIKGLMPPFDFDPFYTSRRFGEILKAAGSEYEMAMKDIDQDKIYIMACSAILNRYFKMPVDVSKPYILEIPNAKTGKSRYYRMAFNVDLMEPLPTDKAKMISEEDYYELIDNYDNAALWKEKFPVSSWIMRGIGVINLMDVTLDYSIASISTNLVVKTKDTLENVRNSMRTIFNIDDLEMGFVAFDDDYFYQINKSKNDSLLLGDEEMTNCINGMCEGSYKHLITQNKPLAISDVEKYYETTWAPIAKNLIDRGIHSYLIVPLNYEGKVQGYLEMGSRRKYELNSASYNKIKDVDPILAMAAARFHTDHLNEIEAVIQQECTTIHDSVKWKFEQEAEDYLSKIHEGENAIFDDIVFKDVYPLYGQIDIKGSSSRRNNAVISDLVSQLKTVKKILTKAEKAKHLPIFEELIFRVEAFINDLSSGLMAGSENSILNFLNLEIYPVFDYMKNHSKELKREINKYEESLNEDTGVIYDARKDFDESVMKINRGLAQFLDERQAEAQGMFPHYFERYKTDGVEYNMYIGESIVKNKIFDPMFLKNLRLWQLITSCQMENKFIEIQKELKVKLEVASLILVYNTPLSIHFRMDEKKFDVEGAYNARYEIVKKRVDKAHIKGTTERITTPGKISIIYSREEDKLEYLKYLEFLENKGLVKENSVEDLVLEDLQGITGLRALRVEVNYSYEDEPITYEELMKSI